MTELTHVGIPPYLQKKRWWKISDWRREKLFWQIFHDWTYYPFIYHCFCYGVNPFTWISVCTGGGRIWSSFAILNSYMGYYMFSAGNKKPRAITSGVILEKF
jgi:hypothetical protein